jgi:hypothetical protein
MTLSAIDGAEFIGGRVSRYLFELAHAGLLLFLLSLLLMRWLPRLSAASAVAASLLVSPILLYFVAPGPFRRMFKGEWSVPLNSNFAWNTWAILGTVAALAALIVSVRSFYGLRHDHSR